MDALKWLTKEQENANAQWDRAALDLSEQDLDLKSRRLSQYQHDYWSGYANAITNVLNELYGPGDTN